MTKEIAPIRALKNELKKKTPSILGANVVASGRNVILKAPKKIDTNTSGATTIIKDCKNTCPKKEQ